MGWGVHRHKYASLGDSYLVVVSAFASLSFFARRVAFSLFRLGVSSRTVFLYSLVAAQNNCTHHSLFLSFLMGVVFVHSEGWLKGLAVGMITIPICAGGAPYALP